jgi:cation-transporting ATPase E
VKVLSGDHPAAVAAIAAAAGLTVDGPAVDARTLGDDDLDEMLANHAVFGRVTPQRKREMVRTLQRAGHVVAMTGDGVNDALALKDADIGVAMGSGSDATRAVAKVLLLDSTFEALPHVVAEGRRVLGNIERTSALYLTKTVYAMLIALAVGVLGYAFPFLPRHLTLIGAVTIGIPSFFLALAPNEERFRPGFVRRVRRFALPVGVLAAMATLFAYALARSEPGISLGEARTAAVLTLTWIGFGVLSIVAAPLTAQRLLLIWGLVAGFGLVLALPATREFFALHLPPLVVSLAGIGIAALVWSLARLFVPEERPVGRTAET